MHPEHDLQKPAFIHLGVRSPYSISEGAIRTDNMIEFCKKFQINAIGITDTANLFGALRNATSLQNEGIQPIIGIRLPFILSCKDEHPHYIYLYPSSYKGYLRLIELASIIYTHPDSSDFPAILLDNLLQNTDDIIAHTGTSDGLLLRLINKNKISDAKSFLKKLSLAFQDRLYVAIARHQYEKEKSAEPWILNLAHEYKLPLLAFQDALFYKSNHYKAQCILYHIHHKDCHLNEIDLETLSDQHYLKNPKEMGRIFRDLPEALENTVHFPKRIAFMPKPHKPMMPRFDQNISHDDEDNLLKENASRGLAEKLKAENIATEQYDTYKQRLDFEINVIVNMGYAGYFLIVADFVNWAINHDIPVGPGRGSGAGSLVAWSLGITLLNPIKWNLMFERFLNPDRISLPDFDIDFCPEGRDDVILYVAERYGREYVAQIITFGALRARAAVQDVGRAIGRPYSEIEQTSKQLPQLDSAGKSVPLSSAIEQADGLKKRIKQDKILKEWFSLALEIEGLYRNISTHAGGIVIAEQPLKNLVPLYVDAKSLLHSTQFDMGDAEKSGLVKFDFLGLSTLTVINKTIRLINQRHGLSLSPESLNLEDEKTFQHISSGETFGLFQIESAGMRAAIIKLEPSSFEEIIAIIALYRPGPMDEIPAFINRKHGREKIEYQFPQLKSVLEETYGIVVYQEQVIQIAQSFAGFTLAKADILRRAMGKKEASVMESLKKEFIESAIQHAKVSVAEATGMFAVIEKFSSYGFNKSHSAGYALVCYQTAYLKTHFPLEFFVTSMNNDINNTDRLQKYLEPLRLNKIRILQPDINRSEALFSIEHFDDEKIIRIGLGTLKNVSPDAMQKLIDLRKQTHFSSIEDFAKRVHIEIINKRTLENIFSSGAFDTLGYHRTSLLDKIEDIIGLIRSSSEEEASAQGNLFDAKTLFQSNLVPTAENDPSPPPNKEKLGELERTAFGFYFSQHPLLTIRTFLKNAGFVFSHELQDVADKNETSDILLTGELIRYKKVKGKKNNENFILYLEDMTGTIEVFLWERNYQDLNIPLSSLTGSLLYVEASLQMRDDRLSLSARDVKLLNDYLKNENTPINISFDITVDNAIEHLKQIKMHCTEELEEDYSGVPIYLTLKDTLHSENSVVVDTKISTTLSKSRLQTLSAIEGVESIAFYRAD